MPKKVLLVFGTRPDAIKMCPLVKELKNRPAFEASVCVSGQHRALLDSVLKVFDVVPDYDLSVMKENQSLFDITGSVLLGMRGVIESAHPDLVLVHGDTSTAFAAALAAFYLNVPVGHVEAGLRTHDIYAPYPEEFNRQAVSLIAKYHFAPTLTARKNLLAEGKSAEDIFVVGNTGIDALKTTVAENFSHPVLDWAKGSRLIFITSHRRENLGAPMREMFAAIREVVEARADVKAVYPVHPNPKVQKIAKEVFDGCERIMLCDPVDVIECHNIMARSYLILTDSGGIQEEAPALGKPVLVLRDKTERPEGIKAGTLKLAGTSKESIARLCAKLLDDPREYRRMARAVNPYGDGTASKQIADILEK